MNELKVLVKKVDEMPEIKTIDSSLESLQKVVGGLIEVVYITDDILLIINEEGKINDSEMNFTWVTIEEEENKFYYHFKDFIFGDVFFVGDGGSTFKSLTDEQIHSIVASFDLNGTLFIADKVKTTV